MGDPHHGKLTTWGSQQSENPALLASPASGPERYRTIKYIGFGTDAIPYGFGCSSRFTMGDQNGVMICLMVLRVITWPIAIGFDYMIRYAAVYPLSQTAAHVFDNHTAYEAGK
jgi:hypothetical protein